MTQTPSLSQNDSDAVNNSDAAAEPSPPPNRSHKAVVIRSSMWSLGGYGFSQIMRLANNLILTRLLFPEVFGVMALISVVLAGIQMFSDVGIAPAIIQNPRGDEPKFLNTAFTIQVFRGYILFAAACLLAYPFAAFYETTYSMHEPIFAQLVPVAALSVFINGFQSTALASCRRHMQQNRLTIVSIVQSVVSLTAMIIWAYFQPTVYAIVFGTLIGCATALILSHVYLPKKAPHGLDIHRNRLTWDPQSARELIKFGRWIFLSTMLTFIALQSDRLVLGKIAGFEFLAFYTIAAMLDRTALQGIKMLGSQVLFPSYSRLVREKPERLYHNLLKSRCAMTGISWVASLCLIITGGLLIDVMYDDRYQQAGWMLQLLPLSTLVGILSATYSEALLARGKTFNMMLLQAVQIVLQFTFMILGEIYYGHMGLILGLVIAQWLLYPAYAIVMKREKLWQPQLDLPVIGLAIIVATASLWFHFG